MATWELRTDYKKNAIERQFWFKDGVTIIREDGYRWATFTTESDEKPNIDLHNDDGYEIGQDEYDWQLDSMDDGCWADWEFPDDMSEEEQEKIENAWDEDFYEGVEELGWSNDDTEYHLHGPLRLINVDTGEEFSVINADGNIIPKEPIVDEEDLTEWYPVEIDPVHDGRYETNNPATDGWPFPNIKMLDWAQGKWWDGDCNEVDKSSFKQWRGLINPDAKA